MTVSARVHAAAALVLAGVAVTHGNLAAFLGAPLVCALALQALALARGPQGGFPRRSVGMALGVLLFGGALLVTGSFAAATLLVAAGLAVSLCATHASALEDAAAAAALPDGFDLRRHAGLAADELLRLVFELRAVVNRAPEYARIAAEARIAADRNLEEGWDAHPERAYPIPPPVEKSRLLRGHIGGLDDSVQILSFESEFEPQDPEIRDEYLAALRNRTAQAVLLRHRSEPRPTLIYCHGYGLGQGWIDARMSGAARLHRQLGLDVALFTLPLHGARSLGRRSGAGSLDGHPLWTNAVLGQAVWDLRRLAGFLRAEGAPAVGVFGVSFGGYVASVFASVEERLACVVSMNTPTSLESLFWRQLPPNQAAAARAAGLTPHVLSRAWARHDPLRMRPRVTHAGRLVIGGLGDRVVAPEQVRALWEHWGRPALHWYPGTHTVWLGLEPLRNRLDEHLRASFEGLD